MAQRSTSIPGKTLKVRLVNTLPPESSDTCPPNATHDTPHCFNTVNLHTHGLHVSPSGNSDNVFVSVPPGASADYVYQIPANHPAGTFWYHSHHHGSVAIDVTSGMAGVLIVRGHRTAARRAANGGLADINTILHDRAGVNVPSTSFCSSRSSMVVSPMRKPRCRLPIPPPTRRSVPSGTSAKSAITDRLEFSPGPAPGHAGQRNTTWEISDYSQINGVVQPLFPSATRFLPAGQIQRWRFVHGGDRDTINMKVVQANLAPLGTTNAGRYESRTSTPRLSPPKHCSLASMSALSRRQRSISYAAAKS